MQGILTRIVAAAVVVFACAVLAAPSASAETSIGWLRVSPASGTLDTPIDVLTQAQCPAGESVVVDIEGPGIPSKGDLGYIVGNTAIEALPDTGTGQLYVPLSLTLRAWFGRNVPGATPKGTYTITLVCRDRLRSSQTFGSYTARLSIDSAGAYAALGEAAKPLGIQVGSADPFAGGVVTEEPSTSVKPSPQATPSTPEESSAPAERPATSEPTGVTEPGPETGAGTVAEPGAEPGTEGAAAPAVGDSGRGSVLLVLALAGAALILGAFLVNRRRTALEPAGDREAPRANADH